MADLQEVGTNPQVAYLPVAQSGSDSERVNHARCLGWQHRYASDRHGIVALGHDLPDDCLRCREHLGGCRCDRRA